MFYVYIIFFLTGIPCYVGKGKGNRWKDHFKKCGKNKHLWAVIQKSGGILPVVIVRDGLSNEEAYQTEVQFIAAIGRKDKKLGPLLNHSDGGDGVRNHSEAGRAILAETIRRRLKGKPMSPQTKQKLSIAKTGVKQSPEHTVLAVAGRAASYKKSGRNPVSNFGQKGAPGPITDARREGIRAGVTAFWERRRQLGLPLRRLGSKP